MSISYNLSLPQIRLTTAQFTATNPTPLQGQLCIETDTSVVTVGDQSQPYLTIRGNRELSSEERQSADDVYATGVTGITTYRAFIHQIGEEAPVVDVTLNNTGYVIQWFYEGPGNYSYSGTPGTESIRVGHNVVADLSGIQGSCVPAPGTIMTFDDEGVLADDILDPSAKQEVVIEFFPGR